MNLPEVGPIDRAQTHRAGFTGGVDLAIPQRKRLQSGASFADGDDLGVRGGIVRDRDAIDALSDDVSVFDDDGAERATLTGKNVIEGELNGASHERVVHAFSLVACVPCVTATANPRKWVDMDSFAAVSLRREYKADR